MLQRVLAACAIWAIAVGCGLAFTESQRTPTADQPPPNPPAAAPQAPVHHEMNALDRRSRFDMILYPGQLGQPELAGSRKSLDPIALSVGPR